MSVRIVIDDRDVRRIEPDPQGATDRLTAFLYLLIRDYVTLGEVEQVLDDVLANPASELCQDELVTGYVNRLKGKILDDPGRSS